MTDHPPFSLRSALGTTSEDEEDDAGAASLFLNVPCDEAGGPQWLPGCPRVTHHGEGEGADLPLERPVSARTSTRGDAKGAGGCVHARKDSRRRQKVEQEVQVEVLYVRAGRYLGT